MFNKRRNEPRIRGTKTDTVMLVITGLRLVLPALAAIMAGAFLAYLLFSLLFL